MAPGELRPVIHQLRRLVGPPGASSLTDAQLLERFVTLRDQAAFELLVWRHAAMVLGVCRRVLHHEHDAEDAFQATFLIFVRKAEGIGKSASVGSWLYKVAVRVALAARARAARRSACEQARAVAPVAEPTQELLWHDLRPVLDEEVSRLPDKYRVPFVLCYLEGKTVAETADQLGCPRGTIGTRLARARERLRRRLTHRGVALSGGALAEVLAQNAASAAPPTALVISTIEAATRFAAGGTAVGVISAQAAALMEGVMKAMFLTKLKIATMFLLTVAIVGAGGGVLTHQALADKQAESQKESTPQAAEQPKGKAAEKEPVTKWKEPVTKWEYKSMRHHDPEKWQEALNKLGDEGWELAGLFLGDTMFILKRPKG
jgi:RNA polymerase sigma factor (sigma-70 family)